MKFLAAALVLTAVSVPAWADEPDGLTLPPGFHASVVADGLGSIRHMAVRDNGDIYVSTAPPRGAPSSGIIALHLGADHKADQTVHFSTVDGGTGIGIHDGALYAAAPTTIYRFAFSGDALVPTDAPEAIVDGMSPMGGNHPLAFDGSGNLYFAISAQGNICTDPKAPKDVKPVGLKPCPGLAERSGIWRFDAGKVGQKFPTDGEQIATGVRNMGALSWRQGDALYGIMHGRDATHETWPDLVSATDDDNIADEMHRIVKGSDLGWPYTYYDGARKMRLVSPEYGGDGKTAPQADTYSTPVASFYPKRPAPLDVVFYSGRQFPSSYRGGAFIAFHGGGGAQLPEGHAGYDVGFVPFDRAGHAGAPVIFADGFAGSSPANKNAGKAMYRPVGVAVAPDGSLYVADSNKGRIWRIYYGNQN